MALRVVPRCPFRRDDVESIEELVRDTADFQVRTLCSRHQRYDMRTLAGPRLLMSMTRITPVDYEPIRRLQ
jgi:hypothetical protein